MQHEIDPLLRLPAVLQVYPVSRSQWWAMIRKGKAPRPVKLSARCSAWRTSDIQRLIAEAGDGKK